ncbi:MAG: hypothetical protein LUC90_04045 [Lachnospiraceae bacterium]|nr:hypothetical protein [Lachnospiraceae bacterium]
MADLKTGKELSEEERMKQMAAQMRAAEYKGLSEEEIQEKEGRLLHGREQQVTEGGL